MTAKGEAYDRVSIPGVRSARRGWVRDIVIIQADNGNAIGFLAYVIDYMKHAIVDISAPVTVAFTLFSRLQTPTSTACANNARPSGLAAKPGASQTLAPSRLLNKDANGIGTQEAKQQTALRPQGQRHTKTHAAARILVMRI